MNVILNFDAHECQVYSTQMFISQHALAQLSGLLTSRYFDFTRESWQKQ